MPPKGEAKKAHYAYMRRRREEDRAFVQEARLRAERRAMKKAVHRLSQLEKWQADGEKVDESAMSLAQLFNDALEEERARLEARDERAVERAFGYERPKIQRRARSKIKGQAKAKSVEVPTKFQSVP